MRTCFLDWKLDLLSTSTCGHVNVSETPKTTLAIPRGRSREGVSFEIEVWRFDEDSETMLGLKSCISWHGGFLPSLDRFSNFLDSPPLIQRPIERDPHI
jgi:hypothetical protein